MKKNNQDVQGPIKQALLNYHDDMLLIHVW
jgi:hypothetical protein